MRLWSPSTALASERASCTRDHAPGAQRGAQRARSARRTQEGCLYCELQALQKLGRAGSKRRATASRRAFHAGGDEGVQSVPNREGPHQQGFTQRERGELPWPPPTQGRQPLCDRTAQQATPAKCHTLKPSTAQCACTRAASCTHRRGRGGSFRGKGKHTAQTWHAVRGVPHTRCQGPQRKKQQEKLVVHRAKGCTSSAQQAPRPQS